MFILRLKFYLPLFIIGVSLSSFSADQYELLKTRLSRCLGQEELKIYRDKLYSAQYHLNQLILENVLQLSNVTLKDEFYNQACGSNQKTPSFKLLEIFLTQFENSFKIVDKGEITSMTYALIDGFVQDLRELLKQFIKNVRLNTPYAQCLQEFLPEIYDLEEDLIEIPFEMSFKDLVKKNTNIQKVINVLKDPEPLSRACQQKLQEKQSEENNKQSKSNSN